MAAPTGVHAPAAAVLARPLLRGWFHLGTIPVAVAGAAVLAWLSAADAVRLATVLVYGVATVMLFTVSALYHRVSWSPPRRALFRRLDHSTIFVMIAATYTPIAVNLLAGGRRVAVMVLVWTMAAAGIATVTLTLPRWFVTMLYLSTGWVAIGVIPSVAAALGPGGLAMISAGGALYSLGAAAYTLRRPDPWPRVFGYHEIFHVLVIAAAAMFYLVILLDVVHHPRP